MTNPRLLMTANAGCGKTFNLANRVIGWMIERHRLHDDIGADGLLAATFTRKAAGEIFQRILKHLAMAVLDEKELWTFADTMAISPPATRSECAAVLDALVHQLDVLQVGTLDALFGRLASACPDEAGLPAGWTIGTMEVLAAQRRAAFDAMLDDCDEDKLQNIVIAAEDGVLKGRSYKGLDEAVYESGTMRLWRRAMRDNARHAWTWLLDQPVDKVFPGARLLDDAALQSAMDALLVLEPPQNKSGSPSKHHLNAASALCGKIREGAWVDVLETSMPCAVMTNGTFHGKPVPEDWCAHIRPLVGHALAKFAQQVRGRMAGWVMLTGSVATHLDQAQRQTGVFGFDDIARILAEQSVLSGKDPQWLQFKLDASLRDVALDEFQDTSQEQYLVLEPVLREVFAGRGGHDSDRRLLVVADVKQSIYGWRGGTPDLLGELSRLGGDALAHRTLQQSWRSSPVIMDFINDVFADIANNTSLLNRWECDPVSQAALDAAGLAYTASERGPVAEALHNWPWAHHESARPEMPGSVAVHVPTWHDSEPERKEAALDLAVELIECRAPHVDSIGVLLSSNKMVHAIAAKLREAGVSVREEGAGDVTELPAVESLLCLLHLAEHPGDRYAAWVASKSPAGEWARLPTFELLSPQAQNEAMQRAASRVRLAVEREGLERTISAITAAMLPACDQPNSEALHHVVEIAAAWQAPVPVSLAAFIEHVNAAKISAATSATVRVMTIHGAKGLEFDEVVLPWLDGVFVKEDQGCLALTNGPLGEMYAVAPRISSKVQWTAPALEAFRQQALARSIADRLSQLYVAMTRPRRALHLVLQNDQRDEKKDKPVCSPASLLKAALPEIAAAIEAADQSCPAQVWSRFQGQWEDWTPTAAPQPPAVKPVQVRSTGATPAPPQSTTGRLQVVSGRPRRDGIALHECMACIEWADDDAAINLDSAFDRAALQTGRPLGPALREAIVDRVNKALQGSTGDALRRTAHDHWQVDSLEVLPEVTLVDERGEHRLDRLVLGRRDGIVVHAAVLDFKSGVTDEALAIEQYQTQLDRYRDVVCGTWNLASDAVDTRLLLLDA